jgi:cobalamin biosynthesis Mg chelatase CobN
VLTSSEPAVAEVMQPKYRSWLSCVCHVPPVMSAGDVGVLLLLVSCYRSPEMPKTSGTGFSPPMPSQRKFQW